MGKNNTKYAFILFLTLVIVTPYEIVPTCSNIPKENLQCIFLTWSELSTFLKCKLIAI